ncbi:MAG: glycogen/starch/alpha-glucan phosphorylase [Pseudomonadota bacterium]
MTKIESITPVTMVAGDLTADALRREIEYHLTFSIGKDPGSARLSDWRLALSRAIRDRIVAPWFATTRRVYEGDQKRVYYLSMEFLIGRLLEDAISNLGLDDLARQAMADLGQDFDATLKDEPDAALGNGGLGRLAACFLDSMATIGVPAHGYGIRYDHGLFKQSFRDGWQHEEAEDWLNEVHPWEFERRETVYPIGFGGHVTNGDKPATWHAAETVLAAAYDTPTPGWRGQHVNTLRLWSAKSTTVFELEPFNRGDFIGAAAPAVLAQTISRVLYPDDTTPQGKELRLKQEYFFTAASLADILRRFFAHHDDAARLPELVAVQLNDTHPAIAGPELVRLLMDRHKLDFETSFAIARRVLNYTNHTLMPEALEKWPVDMMARVLPRHMQLIEAMDKAHAAETRARGYERPETAAAVANGEVRMGNLAFITANRVNGVSALHTDLMKQTVFSDLHAMHPDRILNQTNGVTPRRWIRGCNPRLASLLTEALGEGWEADLDRLDQLTPLAEDKAFREHFMAAKAGNKADLAGWIGDRLGLAVAPDAMFDIQIKRLHEYKRQFMNILEVAALYNEIRANPGGDHPSRVRIFSGKAAPGYAMAKLIIKLINDIGQTINNDPAMKGRLAVVYPPNYNVSQAERLIPAADLSEQISTASTEASGTGNMKFAMNGALTIGTNDGANVEIRERVGDDNIFIFGLEADEVTRMRAEGYEPGAFVRASDRLSEVVEQIRNGVFSDGDKDRFTMLLDNLTGHDWFMVAADFEAYWHAQRRVDEAWADSDGWARKAVLNAAPMGWFSSDRTIRGYARDIWGIEPA